MKQTAVEWLIEQLENHNGVTKAGFEKCIQEAKDMEKEQLIDAHIDGFYSPPFRMSRQNEALNYYDQTFKHKKI